MGTKIVTFGNEKGGVGKTTLSTTVAAFMAAKGKRVLFIDFAPQGHATVSFGLPKSGGVYDWLVRNTPVQEVVKEVNGEHIAIPGEAFTGQLLVISGNSETVGIPAQVPTYALLDAINELRDYVDVVMMDIDPATSALSTLIYMASDMIVMPTQVEKLSLDGLVSTKNSIDAFKRHYNSHVEIAGVIPNFFDARRALHLQNLAQLKKFAAQQGWPVWQPIRNLTSFGEASNRRRMVYTLAQEDPSAARATEDLEKVIAAFDAVVTNAS
jgi:chromosome partitioning protein